MGDLEEPYNLSTPYASLLGRRRLIKLLELSACGLVMPSTTDRPHPHCAVSIHHQLPMSDPTAALTQLASTTTELNVLRPT